MSRLSNNNAQGEYYLTDVIAMAVSDGLVVETEQPHDAMEVQGANDRRQLAELERHYQKRAALRLMAQGVTLRDPARFDVRGEVTVGRDVLIDINVILEGRVVIEDDVVIGPNCVIKDSTLRKGAVLKANTHLDGAIMGEGSDAGPFARLRPGSVLGARAHVGNFVELKNAVLGNDAKAGHLAYLGDAEIGERTNIGAGTITCNYDGANKHKTVLGDDVFIGTNNSLPWRDHRCGFDHHSERRRRAVGSRSCTPAQYRWLETAGEDQEELNYPQPFSRQRKGRVTEGGPLCLWIKSPIPFN